jgi:predicted metal-dependent RNase
MSRARHGTVLEFLGATQTVTGSRFLLSTPRARVLVDCGLYQGEKELRERNWKPLPVDAESIDSVLLTHAHIDHSGYLPRIARTGFRGPAMIVSASGMATGGRVLHHLAQRLPDAHNSIIFVDFQAAGTRGRALIDGRRETKLLGRHVPVKSEIVDLSHFSVHADQSELIDWLRAAPSEPDTVYVVHGEARAASTLCDTVRDQLGWCAAVPRYRERVLAIPANSN